MSGHGFHVHGPHDHAVEHAAHGNDHGDEGFSSRIAEIGRASCRERVSSPV